MSVRVKAVQTADCIILASDQQVFLAYVATLRMTEPFGFEAREYLRRFALGKPVRFKQAYDVNGRVHGDFSSPIFESLIEQLLEKGWVKLRNDSSDKPGFGTMANRFEAAQSAAQRNSVGIWSNKPPVHLTVRSEVPSEIYGSGRKVPALIERAQSGDRVMLRAMFSDSDHYVGPAFLGGVRVSRDGEFASAALAALVQRVLQRDVRAIFHSASAQGTPLVTILHPSGDIAQYLIAGGLAEASGDAGVGSERVLELKTAQQEAKAAGRGMWKAAAAHRSQQQQHLLSGNATHTVTKVISADTVVIDGNETVQLSSVRAPRRNDSVEYAVMSKEFARKLLIGQSARLQVDGSATIADGTERAIVTLSFGPKFAQNAGLEILKAGWGSAVRHRRDDLARSPFYDEFVAAEQAAEQAKRGVFAAKPPPPDRTQDASESMTRARTHLAALGRRGRVPAVIDFVVSAGRLRMAVPSENCTLMAVLDGAQVPRVGEPGSEEALSYVNREWNQRDVQIQVRQVDKTGAFTAQVWMKDRNLAIELLERGLSQVHEGSANACGLRREYEEIEEQARQKRCGLWSSEDVNQVEQALDSLTTNDTKAAATTVTATAPATATTPTATYKDAVIAHVTDTNTLFVRYAVQQAQHTALQMQLKTYFGSTANAAARQFPAKPRRREAAVDSTNYERCVIAALRGATAEVEYVDTGAVATMPLSQLLPLPEQFSLSKYPQLASALELKNVHDPVKLYASQYVEYLKKLEGKPVAVLGSVVYTADSASATDSLNTRLVAGGYASVPVSDLSEAALAAQKEAQEARLGMWVYGDPREDDDM